MPWIVERQPVTTYEFYTIKKRNFGMVTTGNSNDALDCSQCVCRSEYGVIGLLHIL
jgi:hypothetical protein